ncbi:unnamed protein product, partial [Didymodactylos carnosus]
GLFQVLGTIGLVSAINAYALLPALVAVAGMVYVRSYYAPCLRDLKRLEGTTIRFDWLSVGFIALVTILAMLPNIRERLNAAEIALTLIYSLNLMVLFQWMVRQSVEVETHMTAVERVLEYCRLEQEPPSEVPEYKPKSNWPSRGKIEFKNVSFRYSSNEPYVLKNLRLTINSGEKIGIVGRTGAGKSSFIQTIFRMAECAGGEILIDNINIFKLGLNDLRQRISIIPQDPVLFTGTMRNNLDPFGSHTDTEIWKSLEEVQLKSLVDNYMTNGLDSHVSESGSNLSVGQKQLVCLARAILKKSKILVIDEATANVDHATDELIQSSIQEKFRDCTILIIAHRLRTVIDSDRIMVLNNGEVVEYDSPYNLLENPISYLSELVQQTGMGESDHLRTLAQKALIKRQQQQQQKQPQIEDEYSEDDQQIQANEKTPLLRK